MTANGDSHIDAPVRQSRSAITRSTTVLRKQKHRSTASQGTLRHSERGREFRTMGDTPSRVHRAALAQV